MNITKDEVLAPRIKSFLNELYSLSNNKMISVKEISFGELFNKHKIPISNRRQIILDSLTKKGLLIIEGEKSHMKYKWLASTFDADSLTATIMASMNTTTTVEKREIVVQKSKVLNDRFSVRDKAVILYQGKPRKAKVIGIYLDEKDDTILFEVRIDENTKLSCYNNDIFHTIDDLLNHLKSVFK
jgi:hypothetical protein